MISAPFFEPDPFKGVSGPSSAENRPKTKIKRVTLWKCKNCLGVYPHNLRPLNGNGNENCTRHQVSLAVPAKSGHKAEHKQKPRDILTKPKCTPSSRRVTRLTNSSICETSAHRNLICVDFSYVYLCSRGSGPADLSFLLFWAVLWPRSAPGPR